MYLLCEYISLCGMFACVKWVLHVGWNVYLMRPGPVVCLGITASAFGLSPLKGFIPPADPEDLYCFRLSDWPSQKPGCGSLTRTSMCYSSHVVMSCQKQPWQMLPFPLRSDHVGVTLPTAIIIPIHSHNLFVCTVQRQEIVSSANSMKYKIANLMPYDTRLTKHQRSHEYNYYSNMKIDYSGPHSMEQWWPTSLLITVQCMSYTPSLFLEHKNVFFLSKEAKVKCL